MCIFFNLVVGLADIHTAALQFAVNQRHTVDQQHKVTPAVGQNRVPCLEYRLFGNLIAALTGGNFLTVIDFQTDFFPEVQFICGIVAFDSNGFTIDKTVEFQRRAQTGNLAKNLLHFAVGQRNIIQPVHIAVVFKEDLFPVLDQVFFCFIAQNFRLPSVFFCQQINERRFKSSFLFKCHSLPPVSDKHFFKQCFFDALELFQLTPLEGNKSIYGVNRISNELLLWI